MNDSPPLPLLDLLACPRCDQPLASAATATGGGFRCAGCRVDFPRLGAIPWLFAEPGASLDEWRGRLHFALQRVQRDEQQIRASLARTDLRAATRARLEHLATATADHGVRLGALLAPLALERRTASAETHLALRTRLPADQGLTTYYANVHRDWCWGDEENTASLNILDTLVAGAPPTRVLVLGAGAARLAYDVHQHWHATATVALDFNPLLLLLAERVARGERVQLYEFPIAPRTAADHAVLRTLAAPAPARAGFTCVLADAHRPPFRRGAFDAVITPWLVDILPEQLETLSVRINALLSPQGRWLNFGSLSFHSPDAAARLSVEECAAVIEENGFAAPVIAEHQVPYLCSPASRHGRRERVVAWSATKQRDAKKLPRYEALPDWIVRGTDAVPVSESFRVQAMSTRIHAFIMSLIDGRRSLQDIAKVIVEQRLMQEHEAEPAIRSFLIKMYDDSRRGSSY